MSSFSKFQIQNKCLQNAGEIKEFSFENDLDFNISVTINSYSISLAFFRYCIESSFYKTSQNRYLSVKNASNILNIILPEYIYIYIYIVTAC